MSGRQHGADRGREFRCQGQPSSYAWNCFVASPDGVSGLASGLTGEMGKVTSERFSERMCGVLTGVLLNVHP